MEPTALAPWRDLSIVWFVLWTMIFFLIPGVILFFALKYLRIFNHWLRLPLLKAQIWALRIQHVTGRASEDIAAVPITLHSKAAQAGTTTRGIIDFLQNE